MTRLNPLPTTPGLGTGLYADPTFPEEFEFDDGAFDNALSDDEDHFDSINLGEQMSNMDSQPPPPEVPPREGLYSTPLSWERPMPGLRMNPLLFGMGSPMLDPEQRRLLAIALNAGGSSSSAFGQGTGGDAESEQSSLGPLGSTAATANPSEVSKGREDDGPKSKAKGKEKVKEKEREKEEDGKGSEKGKEKESGKDDEKGKEQEKGKEKEKEIPKDEPTENLTEKPTKGHKGPKAGGGTQEKSKEKTKSGDRSAHNDIERKYRTNLKVKIAELRNAVPSLRAIREEGGEDGDGEGQSRGPPKVSKVSNTSS